MERERDQTTVQWNENANFFFKSTVSIENMQTKTDRILETSSRVEWHKKMSHLSKSPHI